MTPKQWLRRGIRIDQEINVLVHTRDGLKRRLTSAVGVHVEGHNESPDPHKFDRLVELNDAIDRKIDEMVAVKTEITETIFKLEDRRYRELLLLRYINGEDWDPIADELHYSKRHVTKLHGWALDAVAKIIQEEDTQCES